MLDFPICNYILTHHIMYSGVFRSNTVCSGFDYFTLELIICAKFSVEHKNDTHAFSSVSVGTKDFFFFFNGKTSDSTFNIELNSLKRIAL